MDAAYQQLAPGSVRDLVSLSTLRQTNGKLLDSLKERAPPVSSDVPVLDITAMNP